MEGARVVIDIIDNGGQWTHREWRMLRYLGVETQILPNTTPVNEMRNVDGLILSGGAARVGLTGELGNCGEYLELDVPILGICAGHQFMAKHYGGDAGEAPRPEFGEARISLVDGGGALFTGTPDEQTVWKVTMTRSLSYLLGSPLPLEASLVTCKPWRMRDWEDLDSNFILKSMTPSSETPFLRTLSMSVNVQERRIEG